MNVAHAAQADNACGAGWIRFSLPCLLLVTALAYLPSLGGGYLDWDDPWLVLDNPILKQKGALLTVWTDVTLPTRAVMGAEYLPLRDTSYLLELWFFGPSAFEMRLVNLLIYLAAVTITHRWLRIVTADGLSAALGTALFAIHPVHVESAAWIAGRKDVLALLFVALAFRSYVGRGRAANLWVPFCFLLAMLSKSMCISLPLLLPVIDWWQNRRPNYSIVISSCIVTTLMMPIHVYVGKAVAMIQPLAGGGVTAALATMAPVWWRYVELLVLPFRCSVIHDVPTQIHWTHIATLSYFSLTLAFCLAVWQWRRRQQPRWLALLGLLWIPLLPVSQILVPLPNRMADRYLAWSVLAVTFALVWCIERSRRWGGLLAVLSLGTCTLLTAERAALFGNSALLFADATAKTQFNGTAPYQLAFALEQQGNVEGARAAYEEVWRRTHGMDDAARRATNNLARLEARQGDLKRAEAVLLRGLRYFAEDRMMQENLIKVRAKLAVSASQI